MGYRQREDTMRCARRAALGGTLPASWSPNRTRPLCPWPQYAKYVSGDPESAASFECAQP
jgi:hypothetical protein